MGLPHTQGPILPYTYAAHGLMIQGSNTVNKKSPEGSSFYMLVKKYEMGSV
jgi:hypothetical protein